MKTSAFVLSFAQLLRGIVAQQWQVLSYTGLQCNGELLDTQSPLVQPAREECRVLEFPVKTASLVLVVDENNVDTWSFGLYGDNACIEDQDEAGGYRLPPGANSVCIQVVDDEIAFRVRRVNTVRAVRDVEARAISIRAPGELAERQPPIDGYSVIFAEAGGAAIALGNAVAACADGIVGNYAAGVSCGLLAIGAVLLALASARQYQGLIQRPAQGNAANLLLEGMPDYYAGQLGLDAGPQVSEDLVEGYTTTVSRLPSLASRSDDGAVDTYLHLALQGVNKRTGEVVSALMDMDTLTNATTVSSVPATTNNLNRRQTSLSDYTAYYSWDNWDNDDAEQFPRTEEAQNRLSQQIYDYMVSTNSGTFCANLAITDFNGIPQPVNNGYFALIRGRFASSQVSGCTL